MCTKNNNQKIPDHFLTDTLRKWSRFLCTLLSNKTTNFVQIFAPSKSGASAVTFFGLAAAAVIAAYVLSVPNLLCLLGASVEAPAASAAAAALSVASFEKILPS